MSEQRLNYVDLAPQGVAALRSLEHYLNTSTGLGGSLLELVRLRVSLMNGCTYCIGLHRYELGKINETQDRIASVEGWRASDAYTRRERAALAWAEAVTNIQDGHASDADYGAVRAHFDEAELVNLTLAIAGINAWNRLAISFRVERRTPARPSGEPQSIDAGPAPSANSAPLEEQAPPDDGGKVSVDEEAG